MRIFVLLIIFLSAVQIKAQDIAVAINPTLMIELGKNQYVRESAVNNVKDMYEKQNDWYKKAEIKMAQVLLVHEQIYQALYNVNSLFKNAKQLQQISRDLMICKQNTLKAVSLGIKKTPYSVWMKKYFLYDLSLRIDELRKIFSDALNKELLMDAYDREMLLDNVNFKIQMINMSALNIISIIKYNESRAYIYSIPIFGDYIEQDKMIVEQIMQQYDNLYK
ncbi:hypothetical protein J4N46_00305 [Capnocytophaga sp. Marseille-Q4570]|uniref:Uncharacterized protein n=1 Tax=Capnocytophaga bilenii TaxID=2819369 RepID=A0ABS3PUC1_9FLAO|nr:hypothetical protein [Capnocytophaga bilenii]MBO1882911.1 hypothetical protein [Capnocytophaga bilenii]